MIRTIDRSGDRVVQKVVNPQGEFLRYQYGIPGNPMTETSTLAEARVKIGKFQVVLTSKSN
jgi:hypothetical protein